MSSKRTRKVPLSVMRGGSLRGSVLVGGGEFTVCYEDGTTTEYEPLSVPVGGVVTIRVRYRCRACTQPRPPAAEVEHYITEDGRQVVCFVGKAYWRTPDGEQAGYTRVALIEPDYGTMPRTWPSRYRRRSSPKERPAEHAG